MLFPKVVAILLFWKRLFILNCCSYNENLRNKVEEGELIKIDDESEDFQQMSLTDLQILKNDLDDTVQGIEPFPPFLP